MKLLLALCILALVACGHEDGSTTMDGSSGAIIYLNNGAQPIHLNQDVHIYGEWIYYDSGDTCFYIPATEINRVVEW
jgi:hypothetical protein